VLQLEAEMLHRTYDQGVIESGWRVGAAAATVGSRDLHGQYADVGWQRRIFDHHAIYKCKQTLAGVYYAIILS